MGVIFIFNTLNMLSFKKTIFQHPPSVNILLIVIFLRDAENVFVCLTDQWTYTRRAEIV